MSEERKCCKNPRLISGNSELTYARFRRCLNCDELQVSSSDPYVSSANPQIIPGPGNEIVKIKSIEDITLIDGKIVVTVIAETADGKQVRVTSKGAVTAVEHGIK